jgi:hypothetical protein
MMQHHSCLGGEAKAFWHEGLLVTTSNDVFDADDDEPLRAPPNRQDTMGTEPTAALTLPSSGNASSNLHHLIEAYLVEEEKTIPIL